MGGSWQTWPCLLFLSVHQSVSSRVPDPPPRPEPEGTPPGKLWSERAEEMVLFPLSPLRENHTAGCIEPCLEPPSLPEHSVPGSSPHGRPLRLLGRRLTKLSPRDPSQGPATLINPSSRLICNLSAKERKVPVFSRSASLEQKN